MESSLKIKEELLRDPAVSYWLKNALNTLDARDVCDALLDVDLLLNFINHKAVEAGLMSKDSI